MTRYFLDSSVAVRIMLGHSPAAAQWFDAATDDAQSSVIASRLLRTELTRVLRREGQRLGLRDEVLDYVGTLPLPEAVLVQAEAIVPHLKTLDAIHLASLIHSGIDAVVVTHDGRMREVAELVGFSAHDPVT